MITKEYEEKLSTMSPFEIKNELINLAKQDSRKSTSTFLNAGRGNPNWISTYPREAFFLLGQFALEECRRVADNPIGIAGIPSKEGIAGRFEKFLQDNKDKNGASILDGAYRYLIDKHSYDRDDIIFEWA
ncbi:MAG: aspartate 4-decarboxylase, partial [Muribaculaceae bacterium]|nr:aspartate 4-decarboxylase [Muribaculaceae bacterium]